ncbi:WxcM-like domain-containing protein [Candidatus Uhrbacteria bacterium]|nr:WxcM-like domain-containing protein [Candidatus Uhrbacteria bacterium]
MLAVPEVYFIFSDEQGSGRGHGGHFHLRKHETMLAVAGTVVVTLRQGNMEEVVSLSDPSRALLIPPGVWHRAAVPKGAILGVLASTVHDPADTFEEPVSD